MAMEECPRGFLDVFEVGADGFEVGGGAVAQIVQPDGWQPGVGDELLEACTDGFGVVGGAVGLDEEQSGIRPAGPVDEFPRARRAW